MSGSHLIGCGASGSPTRNGRVVFLSQNNRYPVVSGTNNGLWMFRSTNHFVAQVCSESKTNRLPDLGAINMK